MSGIQRSNSLYIGIPVPENLDEDDFSHIPRSSSSIKLSSSYDTIPTTKASDPFPTIDSAQLASYLKNPSSHNYDYILILDARFKYEYNGGHIIGARNVTTPEDIRAIFEEFKDMPNICIVFHCEFSGQRGPRLMSDFRELDRQLNSYPTLNYPNIFLLHGGYKLFYERYPELCSGGYLPMRDNSCIQKGMLRQCYSDYTRNMLKLRKENRHLTRTCSLSPSALEAFGRCPFPRLAPAGYVSASQPTRFP